MDNIVPFNPNQITLDRKDILSLVHEVKWAYRNKWGVTPRFLVVGGNPLTLLKIQLNQMAHLKNGPRFQTIQEVDGMVVIQVKRDSLECGE
jgi:hypothetical protein